MTAMSADVSGEHDAAGRGSGRSLAIGGAVLAIAMMIANAANYGLNIMLGRWLTPAEFADANLMVTLMLLVTGVAVTLQMMTARYAGIHQARGTDERADAIACRLRRTAAMSGCALAAVLALPSPWWSEVFRTESAWPFVILAVGMPAYMLQAVGRGLLQGRLRFGSLAWSFVIEAIVRVGVALVLVAAGFGVPGATIGLTASFVATWIVVRVVQPPIGRGSIGTDERRELLTYAAPVLVVLAAQIIINNGDVLVVKAFFARETAGVYAAVALVGRAVFFVSWSAVTTLFPVLVQKAESGAPPYRMLGGGIVIVGGACLGMIAAVSIFGDSFFSSVFGTEYAGVGGMLVRYAIATSMFAIANLLVTFHLAAGRRLEAWTMLTFAVVQTVALLIGHSTLDMVIRIQIIVMATFLSAIAGTTVFRVIRPDGQPVIRSQPQEVIEHAR